ncbi:hypothetical protein EDD85DRAFT_946326 [Armillaria nabsnona]|nr:hypothetical protein EDD85DRAFT_946326 [Armillaria nabsnona]
MSDVYLGAIAALEDQMRTMNDYLTALKNLKASKDKKKPKKETPIDVQTQQAQATRKMERNRERKQASPISVTTVHHAPVGQRGILSSSTTAPIQCIPMSAIEPTDVKSIDTTSNQSRSLSEEGMTLNKAGIVLGETEVGRMIRGHVQKARIQSRDALPDALQVSCRLLKTQVEKGHDLDQEIKKKILEEEPFEGEHWEGVYGLPPESVKNWHEPDSQSDVSSVLSLDSEDLDLDDSSESLPTPPRSPSPSPPIDKPTHDVRVSISHHKGVEELQSRQYWRNEWKMPIEGTSTKLDIGDASTLGPTLQDLHVFFCAHNDDMEEYRTSARSYTSVQHLRDFISHVFKTPSGSKSKTRTLEAFADALDSEIHMWDTWCAGKEEAICKATNGVSSDDGLDVGLLSLEMQIRDGFGESFFVLLDVVRTVFGDDYSTKAPLSTVTASLLDHLFIAMQKHLERGERIAAGVVMRVFIRSAEPLWGMVGRWLKEGIGVGDVDDLDDEFFIESNGLGSGAFGVGHVLRLQAARRPLLL